MLYAFPVLLNPFSVDITKPCLFRSDSMRSSSKSLNHFPCRSDFSWVRTQSQMVQYPVNTGTLYPIVFHLIFQSSFSIRESLVSSVYLIILYTCCSSLYELKCVHGHHIRRQTNLMALRMSFDGVTTLIFPISYHYLFVIFDISNIKQPTKDHQTSKENRH